jgi:hypothetical protein
MQLLSTGVATVLPLVVAPCTIRLGAVCEEIPPTGPPTDTDSDADDTDPRTTTGDTGAQPIIVRRSGWVDLDQDGVNEDSLGHWYAYEAIRRSTVLCRIEWNIVEDALPNDNMDCPSCLAFKEGWVFAPIRLDMPTLTIDDQCSGEGWNWSLLEDATGPVIGVEPRGLGYSLALSPLPGMPAVVQCTSASGCDEAPDPQLPDWEPIAWGGDVLYVPGDHVEFFSEAPVAVY